MIARSPGDSAANIGAAIGLGVTDLVVDAGVAIKWYVPEIHEQEAKRFLDPACTLHVPELFYSEFGNIVWKKARLLKSPEITEEEGRDIIDLLLGVSLSSHPMAPLLNAAYQLGVRCQTRHSLRLLLPRIGVCAGCRLATADRQFYESFIKGPLGGNFLWVTDPI